MSLRSLTGVDYAAGQLVPTAIWTVVVLLPERTSTGTHAAESRLKPPGKTNQSPVPVGSFAHAGTCKLVVHRAAWLPQAMDTRAAQFEGMVTVASCPACTISGVFAKRRCGNPLASTCMVDVVSRATASRMVVCGSEGDGSSPIGAEQSKRTDPAGGFAELDFEVQAPTNVSSTTIAAPLIVRFTLRI